MKLLIEKIEIEAFKKIRNLTIEPGEGANLFFGSFRSGKTSVCEFIQFVLYGADSVSLARDHAEDALGKIWFLTKERRYFVERRVVDGKELFSFCNAENGIPVETDKTPGEFLTGLDRDSFDLITYFRQARYEKPVFKPHKELLEALASKQKETRSLYGDEAKLRAKAEAFRNEEGTGSLDLLRRERDRIETEIRERPRWEAELKSCNDALAEITEKADENDRRCVFLKADMAGFADDLKLSRNKEDAQELKNSLAAKEKQCRILTFEITQKIGLLTEEELEDMKRDYNRLSIAETSLAQARTQLAEAEENLNFHTDLFTGQDTPEHYREEKTEIEKNRLWRLVLRILGIVLMGISISLYFLLDFLDYDFAVSLAAACSVLLCGIALECVALVFTGKIRRILAENEKASLKDFYAFYETLCAHETTTGVYLDKVTHCRKACTEQEKKKDAITAAISKKVTAFGRGEEESDLLAVCDQIIEANDALYDLKHKMEREEEEYRKLLSRDVERDSLAVSPAFAALQNELSFLSAQNEALYKKKSLLTSRRQEAEKHLAKSTEELERALAEIGSKMEKETLDYQAAELNYTVVKGQKDRFEESLKEKLTESVNHKISFVLSEGESFFFDDNFELCFLDGESILPLINAGGGVVSEMGLLAFRLSLAELLGKTELPMIFDDSFAMLSPDAARELYGVLENTCSQFFIATSDANLPEVVGDSAKVLVL